MAAILPLKLARSPLVPQGVWRNYRGRYVFVHGTIVNMEDNGRTRFVVYEELSQRYTPGVNLTRSIDSFLENVDREGELVPRYQHIGPLDDACTGFRADTGEPIVGSPQLGVAFTPLDPPRESESTPGNHQGRHRWGRYYKSPVSKVLTSLRGVEPPEQEDHFGAVASWD